VAAKWWENKYAGRTNSRLSNLSAGVGQSNGSEELEILPYSMVEPSCW